MFVADSLLERDGFEPRFRARHEDEATGAVLSLTFSGYQRGRFAIMIISSPPLG